jgi:acyl carrier protein
VSNVSVESVGQVTSMLERLLRRPSGSMSAETELNNLSEWDSLAMIEFVAMADTEHGVDLSGEEVRVCSTVADLTELISSKH